MEYIQVLTEAAFRALTGYEGEIAEPLYKLGFRVEPFGDLYRVEDVRRYWPGDRPSEDVIESRLRELRRQSRTRVERYWILHPEPLD